MLRTIEMYTNEYKDTTQKEIRKKKGQFFTPAEVSMRMAAVESEYPKNQWIRVLDPGAGNGILSFAVIESPKLDKSVNHIMQNVLSIILIKISCYGNPPVYMISSYAILHI